MTPTKHHIMAALLALAALCGLAACSESEIASYGGADAIYFNNRLTSGTLSDSTEQTFVYTDGTTIDVPVTIQVMGRAADYDRPVDLIFEGDAVEGTDYELPVAPVVRAGQYSIAYVVRLLKTDALSSTTKRIKLHLAANDHFTTDFPAEGDGTAASPRVSALDYTISFSNQFTVAPAGWNTDFAGPFSVRKLDLLVKLFTDVARADYNVAGRITLAKWTYMQTEANEYVWQQEQNRAMGIAYDEMAFDENGNNLYFGN